MELLGGVLTAHEVGGEREGPKEQKSEQAWQGHSAVFLVPKLDKPGVKETEGCLPPSTFQRGLECLWKNSFSYGVGQNPTKHHLCNDREHSEDICQVLPDSTQPCHTL